MMRRTDQSLFSQWWWTVDRGLLAAVGFLVLTGIMMLFTASPIAAQREGLPVDYFMIRQAVVLPVALLVLLGCSLLSPLWVRRVGTLLFPVVIVLLVATHLIGTENKGAKRWIVLAGFSLQASELLKPAMAIVVAWMLAEWRKTPGFPGWILALGFYLLGTGLVVTQPDIGSTALLTAIFWGQFFVAGLPMLVVPVLVGGLGFGAFTAYHFFPHVKSRVDRFLTDSGDTFQIDRSLATFANGGWFGQGPAEGVMKNSLPDAHADFVFAVIGEEFGFIACLLVLGVFLFIFLRGVRHLREEQNLFVVYAITGLLIQIMAQAFINIASSMNMIPPKGMTLPFISYGGSSLLSTCISAGMLLALTRMRASIRIRS